MDRSQRRQGRFFGLNSRAFFWIVFAAGAGVAAVLFLLKISGFSAAAATLLVVACIIATLLGRVMRVIGRRRQAGVQARNSTALNSPERAHILDAASNYYPAARLLRVARMAALVVLVGVAIAAAAAGAEANGSIPEGLIVGAAVVAASFFCWLTGAYASSRDDFAQVNP